MFLIEAEVQIDLRAHVADGVLYETAVAALWRALPDDIEVRLVILVGDCVDAGVSVHRVADMLTDRWVRIQGDHPQDLVRQLRAVATGKAA